MNILKISLTKIILIFTAAAILLMGNGSSAQAESWQDRVALPVLEAAASSGSAEFLVQLKAQADLGPASRLKTKTEKGAFVFQTLNQLAVQTQQPLLKYLQQQGIPYRSHWVVNAIWVRGDLETIHWLAERPEVASLLDNPAMRVPLPEGTPSPEAQAVPKDLPSTEDLAAPTSIPWNLILVRADKVWQGGYTGKNVVVGGADTGYEWDHPALINQYRGWDGSTADHNYNWYDAFNTTDDGMCTFTSTFPVDDYGHGTHTMGIMVGDDGGSNQIGMAPGAEWIGCRNMQNGYGTPDSYIQCFEFFIAPTDTHCQNPDPSKAPDVISNSWACTTTEGCTIVLIDILRDAVEAVRAAGILSVQSAGNSSSIFEPCSTVKTPAAIYDASFTVGNTNSSNQVVSNSSRGPVTVDGSGRLKPDIAAPGQGIYSSYLNDSYTSLSGTSMAAPHVAGLAALLISARPSLAGQVDQLEQYIQNSAVPVTDPNFPGCGGIPITTYPNNSAGWGRIDAWKAVDLLYPFKYYYPFVPVDVLR